MYTSTHTHTYIYTRTITIRPEEFRFYPGYYLLAGSGGPATMLPTCTRSGPFSSARRIVLVSVAFFPRRFLYGMVVATNTGIVFEISTIEISVRRKRKLIQKKYSYDIKND